MRSSSALRSSPSCLLSILSILSILGIGLLILVMGSSVVSAQPSGPVATILTVRGDVQIKPDQARQWAPAQSGMPLSVNDELMTGPDGVTELQFDRQSFNVVRLDPGSRLRVRRAAPVRLHLQAGTAACLIDDWDAASTFELRTPTALLGVRGTGWTVEATSSQTLLNTFEGAVWIHGFGPGERALDETDVLAGSATSVTHGRGPSRLTPVSAKSLAAWTAWARSVRQRRPPGAIPVHTGPRSGLQQGSGQALGLLKGMMRAAQQQQDRADEHHDDGQPTSDHPQ